MNRDYEIFKKHKKNLPELVTAAFTLYENFIYSKAIYYSKVSYSRIDSDDFVSDVYVELFYFLGRIKISKIKDKEKFSFYIYMQYAVSRVYKKCRKLCIREEPFSFLEEVRNSDTRPGSINSRIKIEIETSLARTRPISSGTSVDFSKFLQELSERQRAIVNDRMKEVHETVTLKKLDISHGTYNAEMKNAKVLFQRYI